MAEHGWSGPEEEDDGPPNPLSRSEAEDRNCRRFFFNLKNKIIRQKTHSRREEQEHLGALGVPRSQGHSPSHYELEGVYEELVYLIF